MPREDLPRALVLGESLRAFHPAAEFAILVLSQPNERITVPNATVLTLRDVGFERGDEWRWPMVFTVRELVALVKPALFETLFRKNPDFVAWFSPSTQLFAPLPDAVVGITGSSEIIATAAIRNEWGDCGRSFFAMGSGARPLVNTWLNQTRQEIGKSGSPRQDEPEAFEKLFDALPHRAVSLPGFAVNYSTLDRAELTCADDGYKVGGIPLSSFDFRGYDITKPHLLSRYLGLEPRILLSEHPGLADLCEAYRAKLLKAGQDVRRSSKSEFDLLPSGLRIDPRMLRLYFDALAQHRAGNGSGPPSPFGPDGENGFVAWLNEPIDGAGEGVTRYMLAVYDEREDVRKAYPDPLGSDAAGFRNWYHLFGFRELEIPEILVDTRPRVDASAGTQSTTVPVNVAGYFRAELGIGVAARALLAALDTTDTPVNTISFNRTANRLNYPFADRKSEMAGSQADINLVCINPDQIGAFVEQAGPELWHGRYTIGVWFWEAEDFPLSYHYAFNHVDEIWVASDFVRQTFLKVSPKPVFKYLLPVPTPSIDRSITRAQLGIPEQFTFLFSFDFLSVLERKNPLGLIAAFSKAFAPGEGPCLIIKTINGDKRILEMEKLRYATRDRSDILLMDGYLPAVENATFTALTDCYVSLHRSEGFGLTIADAMALGKPVIATAYSGNLDFMTAQNSYLCPASRTQIGPEREPYPAGSYWSEPDLSEAARLLRYVYENREEAGARGSRAAEDIRTRYSAVTAGKIVTDRLVTIRRRRLDMGPPRSSAFLQDRIDELESQIRLPKVGPSEGGLVS
jgi:glycosyltransferase involved in cell wall biosynthesis